MTPSRTLATLILVLAALLGAKSAGGEVLPFAVLGLEEGLPQSQAGALAQDADGYLWVGTWGGGLARYNGEGFTTYQVGDGLPANRIEELLLDRAGVLWVATTLGLAAWRDHRLETVDLGFADGIRVRALAEDATGQLWVGTDRGVLVLDADQVHPRRTGVTEALVYDLLIEPEGVLAVTDQGLFRFAAGGEVEALPGPPAPSGTLRAAVGTGDGLWVGTAGDGVFLLDDAGWRAPGTSELPARRITRLVLGRSGTLYVASQDAGLLLRPPSQRTFEVVGADQGLPSALVNDVLEDREGNLWIATEIGGLARLRSGAATIHGVDGSFPSSCIFGIGPGAEADTLWVATLTGAVRYRSRPPYGVLESVTAQDGLVDPRVWDVAALPNGEVWAFTESHYQVRRPGQRRFDPPDPALPLPRVTHGMTLDGEGRLWVSGLDAEHPLAMRDSDGRWRSWSTTDDGRALAGCRSVAPRRAGGVWASAGPDLLVGDGRAVRRLPGPPLPPDLTAILEDSVGRLWVGNAGGLAVRDPGGRWRTLGREDGFAARQVFFIGQDRDGVVWVGVDRGVLRFLPDGKVLPFATEDGLAGLETNQHGFHAGADGEVWLGTVTGMTRYDPSRRPAASPPPPLVVESAELPDRVVDFPQHLDLRWSERSVTFRVALLGYRDRSQIAYRARLEGLEDDWLPPRRGAELRYTNLPAGEHELLLEPVGDGGRVGEVVRLPIRVVAPPWRTRWFQGGALLLLVAGVAGAHRLRVHVLQRRAAELERVVAERTEDLRLANDELERLASRDALTGLANRRAILDRLGAELDRGSRRLGCLLVDLDHFKEVNDRLGHAAGDRVLRRISSRIAASLRDGDVAGRYGGDEFLVVLPGADLEGLTAVARRLGALEETASDGGHTVCVSISCGGVVVASAAERDPNAVLAAADALLYEVKSAGRAGFRVGVLEVEGSSPSCGEIPRDRD